MLCVQVLYVPSAQALIEGGTFYKGEDGQWDTPEIAKLLLQSMLTNHKQQLEMLNGSSGKSLLQVIDLSLSHQETFHDRTKDAHAMFISQQTCFPEIKDMQRCMQW